jgi:hypothetical protein
MRQPFHTSQHADFRYETGFVINPVSRELHRIKHLINLVNLNHISRSSGTPKEFLNVPGSVPSSWVFLGA